ncbi:MAG: 3-methyl-2-oxobutanoate hydroxymethyltransferase [Thermodesulfobacteriota bacterium]
MQEKVTVLSLAKMKAEGRKIVMLTAYDFPFARMVDESGVDMILVGDSLGNVIQGESSTLPVTMDQMIYHTRIVSRAVKRAMVVGDMPFMSYQASVSEALQNAGRFLKEAGAAAVKLEGGAAVAETIRAISAAGIPVQAHIGLTPQSVHALGGFKVQRQEDKLLTDARTVQEAGAFSVVLEGIPAEIAQKISETLSIPTIGIGAGVACDGQVLVLHDMLGLNEGHVPKFVKRYGNLASQAREAMARYVAEVREKAFPSDEYSFKK